MLQVKYDGIFIYSYGVMIVMYFYRFVPLVKFKSRCIDLIYRKHFTSEMKRFVLSLS